MLADPAVLLQNTKPLRRFDASMDKLTACRILMDYYLDRKAEVVRCYHDAEPITVCNGVIVDGFRRVSALFVLDVPLIEVTDDPQSPPRPTHSFPGNFRFS